MRENRDDGREPNYFREGVDIGNIFPTALPSHIFRVILKGIGAGDDEQR